MPSSSTSSNAAADVHGDGGLTIEQCQEIVQKNLSNRKVKILIEKLERCDDAKLRSNYIRAVNCEPTFLGYYFTSLYSRARGIAVCSNNLKSEDEVVRTMIHELVLAYDDCRANLRRNISHVACSQIRAHRLDGDCDRMKWGGFLLRYLGFNTKEVDQECVKKRAIRSIEGIDVSRDEAEEAVEDIWSRCYDDTAPFAKDDI